jgi:type III pantothenate kinase
MVQSRSDHIITEASEGERMLFVIDIGNTHTVAGLIVDGSISRQWRIKTDGAMTADELAIMYHNLFAMARVDCSLVSSVVMSSVVPQLESAYFHCCSSLFKDTEGFELINVCSAEVADIITVKLTNPDEVGADRLVNGIAAFHLCRSNAIVIDFGTAITFDCISERCEYLGGLILPGLNVSLGALSQKAAKLPQIDLRIPPEKVIGTSTVSAMKSGVLFGYGAMIEGLIQRVSGEMNQTGYPDPAVIATGGMAPLLLDYSPSIQRIDPNLTLTGLGIIHQLLTSRA